MASMPVRLEGGGSNCFQSPDSETSYKVAMGQSTTMGAGPKLTRLKEVIMESM